MNLTLSNNAYTRLRSISPARPAIDLERANDDYVDALIVDLGVTPDQEADFRQWCDDLSLFKPSTVANMWQDLLGDVAQ